MKKENVERVRCMLLRKKDAALMKGMKKENVERVRCMRPSRFFTTRTSYFVLARSFAVYERGGVRTRSKSI